MISTVWFNPANRPHLLSSVRGRLEIYHNHVRHGLPTTDRWNKIVEIGADYILLHRVVMKSDWDGSLKAFLHYSNKLVP